MHAESHEHINIKTLKVSNDIWLFNMSSYVDHELPLETISTKANRSLMTFSPIVFWQSLVFDHVHFFMVESALSSYEYD